MRRFFTKPDPQEFVHVVYRLNLASLDEPAVLVVAHESEAAEYEAAHDADATHKMRWETVPVHASPGRKYLAGDRMYLLSDGGPSDDAPEEASAIGIAAFFDQETARRFMNDPERVNDLYDPRLRTVVLGEPLR